MVAYNIQHVFRLTAEHDHVKKRELRKVVFDFNIVFIQSPLEIFYRSFLRYKDANFLWSPAIILQILSPAEIFCIPCSYKKMTLSGAAFSHYNQGHQISELYERI